MKGHAFLLNYNFLRLVAAEAAQQQTRGQSGEPKIHVKGETKIIPCFFPGLD